VAHEVRTPVDSKPIRTPVNTSTHGSFIQM
jgi:hypothetical protein